MSFRETLLNNPFARLEAGPTDDRKKLIGLSEDAALFGAEGTDADLNRLLQPGPRLEAEMDWFPGTGAEEVRKVLDCAQADVMGPVPEFHAGSTLARFNACRLFLSGWPIEDQADAMALCLSLMSVDRPLNAQRVRDELARDRKAAGFASEIDVQLVAERLRLRRRAAAEETVARLAVLPEKQYPVLMLGLSKLYGSDDPAFRLNLFVEQMVYAHEARFAGEITRSEEELRRLTEALRRRNASPDELCRNSARLLAAFTRYAELYGPVLALKIARQTPPDPVKNRIGDLIALTDQVVRWFKAPADARADMQRLLKGLIAFSEGLDALHKRAEQTMKALFG